LEPATLKPIAQCAPLLSNVPISRLFDEMVKLLQTGHALASIEQMRKFGLIGGKLGIFPVLEAAFMPTVPNPAREKFVSLALQDTDRRVAEDRPVAPSFMLACMLWHDVQERWSALKVGGEAPFPALQLAVDAVFDARVGDISGRGKLAADMREIWLMQPRFDRRTVSSSASLAAQPRFRAGYDFLRLRADCGELAPELAEWWEDYHLGSEEDRAALVADLRPATQGKARRVAGVAPGGLDATRLDRDSLSAGADDADEEDAELNDGEASPGGRSDSTAPRKRRRRRRRPAGSGSDSGSPVGGGDGSPPTP